MRDSCHTRKYTGERPKGTGKPLGCEGALQEANWRTAAEISNDAFVKALHKARQEDLRTALLVTCELHKPPTAEELTAFERAMARVAAGAGISEVVPFKRRADPDYSLTGFSSRWMAS